MVTYQPRATRVLLPIPITYRRAGEETWRQSTIVNLSESGVLFGATDLQPGVQVEITFSPPIQVGSMATGEQVCAAEVVRATNGGAAAARFRECRLLLEPWGGRGEGRGSRTRTALPGPTILRGIRI
jgi:hypothetical protein